MQLLFADAMSSWSRVLPRLDARTEKPSELVQAFLAAGDGVLQRVRHHVAGAGFHLSEQLDKVLNFVFCLFVCFNVGFFV
jgi:hypothetical protein